MSVPHLLLLAATATVAAAPSISGERAFGMGIMAGVAYVTAPIARLVSL